MSGSHQDPFPGGNAEDGGEAGFDQDWLTPEDLAPIAAVDGIGALSPEAAASIDSAEVERFEAAAGALFAALELERGGTRAIAPPAGFEDRLFGAADLYVSTRPGRSSRGREFAPMDAGGHRSRDASFRAPHESRRSDEGGRRPSSASPQNGVAQRQPAVAANGSGELRAHPSSGSSLEVSRVDTPRGGGLAALAGWAAAAALLIGLLFSIDRTSKLEAGLLEVPAAKRLAQLELVASDVQQLAWLPLGSAPAPKGSVIWSDERNEGFMRIQGLAPNDPEVSQYQLWIFRGTDPAAEPHPVDGGVFNVDAGGEVIVPIDAKIAVGSAGTFAVTVEKPGGVVVSKREQIVLLAQRAS